MSSFPDEPIVEPLGDAAILVTFGDAIDLDVNRRVHECVAAVTDAGIPAVVDVVAAYASLAVHYDPHGTDAATITAALRGIIGAVPERRSTPGRGRLHTISVRYDGPDLAAVARATGLSIPDVIGRHTAREYTVYMMGFAPGFAYLGDLDPALQLPRRDTPRPRVPRGSVAIAGLQTAVYPLDTPGGWHLIGATDLRLFDVHQNPPALLAAGDRVRFVSEP